MDAWIAVAALEAAIQGRAPVAGCTHHSDRGLQICFGDLPRAAGISWIGKAR